MNQQTAPISIKNEIAVTNKIQKPSSPQFVGLDCLELRRRNSLPFRSKASVQFRAPLRTRSLRANGARPSSWNPSPTGSSSDVDGGARLSLKNTKRSPSCDRYFNNEDFSRLNPESMRLRPPRPPSASSIGEVAVGRVADMVRKVEQNLKLSMAVNRPESSPPATRNRQCNFIRSHTINTPNVFIYSTCINQMECENSNNQSKATICQPICDASHLSSEKPSQNHPQLLRSLTLPTSSAPGKVHQPSVLSSVGNYQNHAQSDFIPKEEIGTNVKPMRRNHIHSRMAPNLPDVSREMSPSLKKENTSMIYIQYSDAAFLEADVTSDTSAGDNVGETCQDAIALADNRIIDINSQYNEINAITKAPKCTATFSGLVDPVASLSLSTQSQYNSASSLKFLDQENEPFLSYNSPREHDAIGAIHAQYLPSGSASSRTPSPPNIIKEPVNNLDWLTFKRSNIIHPSVSLYELCQFCDIATVFVSSSLISVSRRPFWWKDDPVSSLGLRTCIARVCIEGADSSKKYQLSKNVGKDGDADRNMTSGGAFRIVTPRPCMSHPVVLLIEDVIPGSPMAEVSGIVRNQILVELNGINLLSTGSNNKGVLLHLLMDSAIRDLDCGDEPGIRLTVASPKRATSRVENGCIYFNCDQNVEETSQGSECEYSLLRSNLQRKPAYKVKFLELLEPEWMRITDCPKESPDVLKKDKGER